MRKPLVGEDRQPSQQAWQSARLAAPWRAALCVALGLYAAGAAGETTLGEVVTTCRAALTAGFDGVDAAACEWFLDPCAICGAEPPPERWCVPPELPAAARAERLLGALARSGAAPDAPARAAVEAALAAEFPCAPTAVE
ncbi:MAG: Rap1a/Tai family immunity protein [Gammaproteobacteria bacterium]